MANVIEITIKGVDKITATLNKVAASIAKVGKIAVKMAKGIAVSATALVGFTKITSKAEDAAAKFSRRIGVAVNELTALQHAAELSGLSTQNFNLSVQRMTRRTAEAAKGMGEAQGALRELNIDAKSFSKLGLEDQMATLADRFGQVENKSDRLRLAFKLFDSEGTAVLQMLGQGSDAMKEMAKDAERLGLVVSKQAAADSEAFNDALTRAWGAIKGVSRTIAHTFMPILTGLANRFADATASARESIGSFVKDLVGNLFTAWEVVKQVFGNIHKVFTDATFLQNFLTNTQLALGAVLNGFMGLGKGIIMSIWESLKAAGASIVNFGEWVGQNLADIMFGRTDAATFAEFITSKVTPAFSTAAGKIKEEMNDAFETVKTSGADAAMFMGEALGVNLDLAKEKAQETINSISEFGKVVSETVATTTEETSALMLALQEQGTLFMENMQNNANTFAESFFGLMNNVIDGISAGIATAVVEGTSIAKVFQNIGKMILTQLLTMFIKLGIQRLVLAAFNKTATASEGASQMAVASATTFGNAFASTAAIPIVGPSLAPGVAAAASAAMLSGAAAAGAAGSALGATVGARQFGGPVQAGASYLVGERGPEVFSPNAGGNIIPNNQIGEAGNGVTIEGDIVFHVMENVTNAEALLEMDDKDLKEFLAEKWIPAMDALRVRGITPEEG